MIRISKYLYIHPLTVALFIVCFFTKQTEIFFMSYIIMTIHELSHLAAALYIGLIPDNISVYPFGLNLKLKNKIVYSLADEIILYAAGPLSNICMALAALIFADKIPYSYEFYMHNIALFMLNMLPVVPLDGGVIIKKIAAHLFGRRAAEKIMKGISIIIILILTGVGIYLAIKSQFNYSVCFLSLFLLCNIFTSDEKYNVDFLRELMFYKEKGRKYNNQKIKTILMTEGSDLATIAKEFSTSCFYVVFCVNQSGKIIEILTETEIMQKITSK